MLFPADFFRDLRVRARMGNFADFPDLTRGSLFPGCHLTFSAATFTRIFPFGPFRAGLGHLHGMPAAAAAWIKATREPTPDPRTVTRSTPARQEGTDARSTSPADLDNLHRRSSHPQKEPRTGDNARRIGRTSPAADRDAEQPQEAPPALILGKCTQEGPQKPQQARFYCFPVSRTTSSSKRRRRPHARPNFGNRRQALQILFRRTSPGDATRGQRSTGANWRQLRRRHAADTDRSTPGTAEGPQKARSRFYIVYMVTNTTALYKRFKSHLHGRSSF